MTIIEPMTETPPPPASADGTDPSMEDILASIRRILNQDETHAAPPDATGDTPKHDDVLVLDQTMMVSTPEPAPHEAEPEAAPQPVASASKAEPPHQEMEAMTLPPQADLMEQPAPSSDLVAPAAAAAAASSVDSLIRTLAAGRATQVYSGGPTLEDIVRAELRPLLKEWLDVNLPPIVERLVRAEIERVVGRSVPC
jgi:cell pole-organizing protein PopZ